MWAVTVLVNIKVKRVILTRGHENIDGGVKREGVNGGKMTVIMTYDFVHLQIPTFHQFVFAGAEITQRECRLASNRFEPWQTRAHQTYQIPHKTVA